jgi:hypothetical protein
LFPEKESAFVWAWIIFVNQILWALGADTVGAGAKNAKGSPDALPECHGRVRAHSTGKNGEAAHFEHHERNPGCSLGHYFDGTKKLHRKVID